MNSGPKKLTDILISPEVEEFSEERPARREKQAFAEKKPFERKKPATPAYQYCLYLLSGQDYSEYKLRQKMRTRLYEKTEIDETIAKLIEKKFLREEEYKKLLVKKLMRKGRADGLIKRQVEQEQLKVGADELLELRAETGVSKDEMITQLVSKKMRGGTWSTDRDQRRKQQEKIYRFLLSRGFSYDDAKKAVKAVTENESEIP